LAGRITALKVQKRNDQRVNVYIDDRFAFGLAAIEAIRLKVGQYLSEAEIAELKKKDVAEVAYERALRYLSYRPRSVAEVQRYLNEKEFDVEAIETAIGRLMQVGLLNDEKFAEFWLENRDAFKPRSRRALRYELRQKGIADLIIDNLLEAYDEVDAAYRAAEPRAQRLVRRYDRDAFRSKLLAFLQRRGFSYSIARDTVERLQTELDEEWIDTCNE
jgi:regulatory protein